MPHHSSNAGEVQHFEHPVGYAVQFGDESVFRIEAPKLCVVGGIHHMIAVGFCADRQISQLLYGDDAAVVLHLFLHCHFQQPSIGDALYLIQFCQPFSKVIQFIETDIQSCQMGSKIRKGIVVFDLHV